MLTDKKNNSVALLVANWKSDVGYAWWLIESYWCLISEQYHDEYNCVLVYPEITNLPSAIENSRLDVREHDWHDPGLADVLSNIRFVRKNNVKWIYFSDRRSIDWKYLLYKLAGVRKIIVHDHSPGERQPPRLFNRLLKSLVARSVFAADALVSVTDYVKDRHLNVDCFPDRKCFVVRNGILPPGEVATVDLGNDMDIPPGRKIMVMTSRANRYKGVDFVIDCMNLLVNHLQRKDLHFLFCGDGPDLNTFKQKAIDLSVEDYISFPGMIDNVPGILAGCDFAIHPSRGEVGYSLSILEYMYAELPVIVPSNPSVCGATENEKSGYIYLEGDVQSAVACIARMLDEDSKRKSMGKYAKSIVGEHYSLENSHRQLSSALRKILGHQGQG